MAVKDIIDYINKNKDSSPLGTLVEELRKAGHQDGEIVEAIEELKRLKNKREEAEKTETTGDKPVGHPSAGVLVTREENPPSARSSPQPIIEYSKERQYKNTESRLSELEQRVNKLEELQVRAKQENQTQPTTFRPPIYKQERFIEKRPEQGGTTETVPKKSFFRKEFESYFGKWVLGIVGIVAIILGASFFLKYVFENNWVTPAGRVILGLTFGVLFVLGGEFMRKRQEKYSYLLSSAGLGLLYLSTYAAYGYYELISAEVSFLFMAVVTVFGIFLSLWTEASILAMLTTGIGFLVPYLFGLKATGDLGYFVYTLSLNALVLSISFFKKWHPLTLLGFIGTVLHFSSWLQIYYNPINKMGIAIYALMVFYVVYLLTTIAHKFIKGEKSDYADLFILTINPAWFFFELYRILEPGYDTTLAFVAVLISVIYIILAYVFQRVRDNDPNFALFLGAISALFLTIAIPLQFKQNSITIAWAVEAVIIAILGASTQNEGMKKASLIILTIALTRFVALDMVVNLESWLPVLNPRFFTYLILTLGASIIAYLFGHLMGESYKSDTKILAVLWTVVLLLIFFAVTQEISTSFDYKRLTLDKLIEQEQRVIPPPTALDLSNPYIYNEYYRLTDDVRSKFSKDYVSINNQKNALISISWLLYAILLIVTGIITSNGFLRKSALLLFGLTVIKVFTVDLAGQSFYRIISFIALGLILLCVSYLYFRFQKTKPE